MKRNPLQPLLPEDENGHEIESPVRLTDSNGFVESRVEQKGFCRDLYQLLEELPNGYRTVLTLVDRYDFDYAEAAIVLRVPIGTVKSRLARARLQMSEELRNAEIGHFAYIARRKELGRMSCQTARHSFISTNSF